MASQSNLNDKPCFLKWMIYYITLHCIVLNCIQLYCNVYYIVFYLSYIMSCIVLHYIYIASYHTVSHCVALYITVPFCTAYCIVALWPNYGTLMQRICSVEEPITVKSSGRGANIQVHIKAPNHTMAYIIEYHSINSTF